MVLAENLSSFWLVITPSQVPDLEETRVRPGEIMPIDESDQEQFFAEVQCKASFQPIVRLFSLSDKVIAGFAVNRHRFPGVDIAAHPSRCRPMLDLAAHAVGYAGRINERELSEVDLNDYSGTSHSGKLGSSNTISARCTAGPAFNTSRSTPRVVRCAS
jgi:penicillin-binding protein 2